MKVLLIEDIDNFTKLVKSKIVQMRQHRDIRLIRDWDALQKVEDNDFDIIICDIELPGAGKPEELKTFRFCRKQWPHIPVLVVSDGTDADLAAQVIAEGSMMVDFATKNGGTMSDLPSIINRLIRTAGLALAMGCVALTGIKPIPATCKNCVHREGTYCTFGGDAKKIPLFLAFPCEDHYQPRPNPLPSRMTLATP